jgi:glycogen phosphorylase
MIERDPVCGMPSIEGRGTLLERAGERLWFCSEFCRQEFLKHPRTYGAEPDHELPAVDMAKRRIAYFTMEVALKNEIPTYSGGLGVLAGDTLRSCADLAIPIVAVSLVHRRGYFRQEIRGGWQHEHEASWIPARFAAELVPRVSVSIERRHVRIRAWRYDIVGSNGSAVPVFLLDTDVEDNEAQDRVITDRLYGGDERHRLMQEVVLGVGGVRLLRAVGCTNLQTFHLNEGHAALAPLELLRAGDVSSGWNFHAVRSRTVFTTHTPVAAGHDQFDRGLMSQVLGDLIPGDVLEMLGGRDRVNMTQIALNVSHYVNGVALRHREVSSDLFPRYEIHQITNGVHVGTWASPAIRALFDRRIPGWCDDPCMLRNALALPPSEVWDAHQDAKRALLDVVSERTGIHLKGDVLTLGFARRATAYKRLDLVFSDLEALRTIASQRPLQFVFAGKAHPKDEPGKRAIQAILEAARSLEREIPIVYVTEYDLELARTIIAGVDVWINTPLRPLEASGTSGMKAALNGVPSFSVLDGWWREGCIEGVTGWSIGNADPSADHNANWSDATDFYRKLRDTVAPRFYDDRPAWSRIMRQAIALNGSFFNTHRMVRQYVQHAYTIADPS